MTTTSGATSGNSALAALLNSMSSSGSSSGNTTTSSPGTGLLSSAGIGSGLDVDSIVQALVNAKQSGPQGQIAAQAKQDQNLEAGLSGLSSVLDSLQSAMDALGSSFSKFQADLSDTDVGSATAVGGATPGTYDISVSSLATAQKRVGDALDGDAPVGDGTLSISVGGQSMQLAVSSTDTLADLARAINQASDNPGVTAAVLKGTNGSQLVLSSNKTGIANAFSVSANATSSDGLIGLANALDTPGQNEASDASFSIDGVPMSSASNTVNGALNGVTLNLAATGDTQLTVAQDTDGITQAAQDFVSAYNQYASTVSQLSSYDVDTGDAGLLLGNATLLSAENQLSSVLGNVVGGNALVSLANIGITRNADGTMSLDTDTFGAALNGDPQSMQDLFTGSSGYVTKLDAVIDTFTGPDGIIPSQLTSLDGDLDDLNDQVVALNQRMSDYQKQLEAQYTNLDTLMTQLNSTSSYLTQSLQAMNNNNNNDN